jgi:hypothetical protein
LLMNRSSRSKPVLWLIFCKGNSQLGIRILHPQSFTRRFFLRWNTNQDWFTYTRCIHEWIWNGYNLMTQCSMHSIPCKLNSKLDNPQKCW